MRHRSFLLECRPDAFRPRAFRSGDVSVVEAAAREAERCRDLWAEVGAGFWTERSRWTVTRWQGHLERDDVSFWIARRWGVDIGCFELTAMVSGVKLQGFGLLPPYRGKGLGGGLVTEATRLAFSSGARRVWLHTATDDHPNALPNYLAAGYRILRERELAHPMPGVTPGDSA
jgi:ribosomal protein S18 acetylase RimI-like enzyme